MMLQVDAQGWGCLVGSAVVGVYNQDSTAFAYRVLPQSCFQEGFAAKMYLPAAVAAVQECLAELQIDVGTLGEVEVCSEFLLSGVREWLSTLPGVVVREVRITSPLRILVTTAFIQVLHGLRFDIGADLLDNEPRTVFRRAILWLRGGSTRRVDWKMFRQRVGCVKSGWPAFQNIRAKLVHGPERFVP